jgi:putative component of membrane protein insertase Oxa1/YidC/SpoIIIJ protein YidD
MAARRFQLRSIPAATLLYVEQQVSLGLINAYQRYLSPYKGFSCAHRVLHGGLSCSSYAKTAIAQHNLATALPLIRQRLRDCTTAAQMLPLTPQPWTQSSQEPNQKKSNQTRRRQQPNAIDCIGDGCLGGGDCLGNLSCLDLTCSGCGDFDACSIDLFSCDGCDCSL